MPGIATGAALAAAPEAVPGPVSRPVPDGPVRRLVCVAPNPSIDKIAAVDRLVPGEIHRPVVLSVVAGGKTLNVARAAAGLGLPVAAVAVLAGHAGAWITDGLAADGVAARPVWVAGETRECLSLLDRTTGRLTELYEAGPAVDAGAWAALEAAVRETLAEDPAGTVLAVSGSLASGAPDDGHARLVRIAREAGARAAVDVGGPALARAAAERPWLAKANAHEAADAAGTDAESEAGAVAAARAMHAAGATMALVTRGVHGAILVDGDGTAWRVGPPPERGAFPVGSGDSLLGGFLAALGDGHPAPEAVRRGAAAGTANALHPGQGRLDPADVARLIPRVTLERLDA